MDEVPANVRRAAKELQSVLNGRKEFELAHLVTVMKYWGFKVRMKGGSKVAFSHPDLPDGRNYTLDTIHGGKKRKVKIIYLKRILRDCDNYLEDNKHYKCHKLPRLAGGYRE